MATNKRTVIGADEELLVKGQLVVTGNVTQIETTQTINRLESDELVINSDGDAVEAKLVLTSSANTAVLSYNSADGFINVDKALVFPASTALTVDIVGNVTGQVSDISNHDTGDLAEGTNLYWTTTRGNTNFDTRLATKNTDDLSEGSGNLYYTDTRARAAISRVDAGGDGSLAYNSTTGVITYTGPSAAEVQAHFSATTSGSGYGGLTYSGGVFTYAKVTNANIRERLSGGTGITYNNSTGVISSTDSEIVHDNLSGFVANEHINHSSVAITAGSGLTGGGDITTTRTLNIGEGTGISVAADSISTNDSQIVHDNLSGFVADEHVAHSGVTLTAGDGLSGGGDITASRSFAVDSSVVRTSGNQSIAGTKTFTGTVDLTSATVTVQTEANADSDSSVASTGYVNNRINQVIGTAPAALDTLGEIADAINDDTNIGGVVTNNTSRISALENRTLTAGDGLSGGGNLTANRSFAVDSTVVRTSGNQTIEGIKTFNLGSTSDAFVEITGSSTNRQGLRITATSNDKDSGNFIFKKLRGSSASQYGDSLGAIGFHSSTNDPKSVIHSVDQNASEGSLYFHTGNPGDIDSGISTTYLNLTLKPGKKVEISGAYTLPTADGSANEVLATNGSGQLSFVAPYVDSDARSAISVTDAGGDGSLAYDSSTGVITYTGPSASEVRAHISGGDGIDFASGTIDVDSTVVRTSSNQSLSDRKTFTGELIVPGSASTATGAIYYDGSEAYIYVSGSARKITPAVDAGDVEGVGAGATDIYAGTRVSGSTTYHGIKSLDDSTFTTITESANVITINADISAIRGQFSAIGETLSYSNGQFTSTADNYADWRFTTPTTGEVLVQSGNLVTFAAGTGIGISHSGKTITFTNTNSADITGVSAGTGLTGGGTAGSVTLNVVGGDGITANANDIEVDNTVVRTSGTQSIAGDKTFTGSTQINALNIASNYNLPTSDGSFNQVLATNGSGQLSFQDVTAIGGTITGVSAGDGLTGGGIAGTVTLTVVGGNGITANANDIEIDFTEFDTGDITEGSNLYFTNTRADARVNAVLPNTDSLGEGSSNLYYTDARADARVNAGFGSRDTDDLSEGSTNLYYTNARADARVQAAIDTDTAFGSASNTLVPSQLAVKTYVDSQVAGKDNTDEITEGSTNLYFTNARARSAVNASGDLNYNSSTGVFSFTERTDSQIRALFSAGGDLSYNSTTGQFSFTDSDTIGTVTSVSVGTGLDVTNGTTTPTISLDLSEFADMTNAMDSSDEFIVLDGGAERRKAINEIALSLFSNDAGFTTNVGDITNVSTSGIGLSGGGASGAVTISSNATSANTGSTIVARDSSGNFSAGVISATATSARYADLAEIYATDQNYQAGTVVVFGGEKEVTVTDNPNSPRVAGVISTDPAYMMNKDAEGQYVALRGRVPCKVIGPVKKGDVLITSDRPGFACVSSDPAFVGAACIVGKAIGEWDTPSEGVVEIMV